MPTMDAEIVMMSRRRYDLMCRAIDALRAGLKNPVLLDEEEARNFTYMDPTECSAEG